MVWYFIGVYKINRTLHGRLEIRNLFSCVAEFFTRLLRSFCEFFTRSLRSTRSPRGHVISSICYIPRLSLN